MPATLLKRHMKPLLRPNLPVEAIYVYGSAVRKEAPSRTETEGVKRRLLSRDEKPGDIDVLVIVNDTVPVSERVIISIERISEAIKASGKESGLEFHFQPPKLLSRWWHSLIEGEPWIISSLKEPLIIHDRKGVVKEVCAFIEKEHLYNKEEKAEKLLERSDYTSMSNRHLLLGTITNLSNAGTEAAQILLLFDGKFLLNKRAIVEELERAYGKHLGQDVIDTYREIVDLEEKVNKGTLSEFSAENLDYYMERIKVFISKVEKTLERN